MAVSEEESSSAKSRSNGVHYLAKCVLRGTVVVQVVQGHIRSPSSNDVVFGKVCSIFPLYTCTYTQRIGFVANLWSTEHILCNSVELIVNQLYFDALKSLEHVKLRTVNMRYVCV